MLVPQKRLLTWFAIVALPFSVLGILLPGAGLVAGLLAAGVGRAALVRVGLMLLVVAAGVFIIWPVIRTETRTWSTGPGSPGRPGGCCTSGTPWATGS